MSFIFHPLFQHILLSLAMLLTITWSYDVKHLIIDTYAGKLGSFLLSTTLLTWSVFFCAKKKRTIWSCLSISLIGFILFLGIGFYTNFEQFNKNIDKTFAWVILDFYYLFQEIFLNVVFQYLKSSYYISDLGVFIFHMFYASVFPSLGFIIYHVTTTRKA